MIGAVWQLIPVALGVMASPLAVLGLIGILLSRRPRRNGIAYLAGWMLSIAFLLTAGILMLVAAGDMGPYRQPGWVAVLHFVIGAICLGGAGWIYLRARRVIELVAAARTPDELAAAAPQLPRLVRSVARYTPPRSFGLGAAIFLNPMNISLVAAAALAIIHTTPGGGERVMLGLGFVVAAAAPVAVPVLIVLFRRQRAEPMLRGLRRWMLKHNGYLSAGVLSIVGVLQIIKAVQVWA